MNDDAMGSWVLGAVMGLLGLLGLLMASRAVDTIFYGTGLALFVFCVLFIFVLINRNVGR
jgi:hypothetical protein